MDKGFHGATPSTVTADTREKTKNDVSFTSGGESIGQVDPDRKKARAERTHRKAVELRQ
jgi:hypothetical protein